MTSTFQERLAKAKAAKQQTPEFRDVDVILDDGELPARIDEIRDALMVAQREEAADVRLGTGFPRSDELREKLDAALAEAADMIVTLRFIQLPAAQWADIKAICPVRLDADIDQHYGFNADKAAVLASPLCGARVDGDELVEMSTDEWRDLFATISGGEQSRIADAHFDLNEYGPARRLEDAKKALATRRS